MEGRGGGGRERWRWWCGGGGGSGDKGLLECFCKSTIIVVGHGEGGGRVVVVGVDKSLLKLFQCFCKSIFAVGHGQSGWEGWLGGGGATRAYSSASAKSIIAMGHGGWGEGGVVVVETRAYWSASANPPSLRWGTERVGGGRGGGGGGAGEGGHELTKVT